MNASCHRFNDVVGMSSVILPVNLPEVKVVLKKVPDLYQGVMEKFELEDEVSVSSDSQQSVEPVVKKKNRGKRRQVQDPDKPVNQVSCTVSGI